MKRMALGIVIVLVAVSATAWAIWPRSSAPIGLNNNPAIHQDADGPTPAATATPSALRKHQPVVLGSSSAHPTVTKKTTVPVAKPTNLVLFVLDGARPDYFNVPNVPHIKALINSGSHFTNAFAGILESETPSGHASIASGSEPKNDGILSFSWATNDNIDVNLFDPAKINNHDMEKITSDSKVATIASLVHQQDRSAKVVALSGHKYYAADALGGPNADVIMYYTGDTKGRFVPTFVPGHAPPPSVFKVPGLTMNSTHLPVGTEDHLAMKLAMETYKKMHQRVTLVNVPEFDWPLGHVNGGSKDPAQVASLMQGFDRDLGAYENMLRQEGQLDNTVFAITADHGMAPVTHRVDKSVITGAVEASGTTLIEDSYTTADYLWIKDSAKAAQAAENIARVQNPYIQSVYFKSPVPGGGFEYIRASGAELFHASGIEAANQYLLNSFNGGNGPDVVAFYTEETSSLPGGQATWKGNHGGADWEAQHIPLIVSGPGVKSGYVSAHPARLIDIAPTALTLMGASTGSMHGIPLADIMTHPATRAVTSEKSLSGSLLSVITALKAESQAELSSIK